MPRRPLISAAPKAGYLAARKQIDAAIARVLASGRYILGPEVEAFEEEFADWLGAAGTVGVANGTDALELAFHALELGPGDRIATVANTVSATAAAIVAAGAEPVFVEIDPATMLMDPDALERALAADPAIKAVVPVHLYGQACDLPRIRELARAHHAAVIEDCAQAHGAAIDGRKAGTWGDFAAFSFYPTKNLGALGDGGAVTAMDPALLERVRLLRQYGWRTRYVSDVRGRNSRLDELQAAILRVRLDRLDDENAARARLAAAYLEQLADTKLQLPVTAPGRTHVWHQFVVRTPKRDALQAHLAKHDIHAAVLYPVPLHHQPAFARLVPPAVPAKGVRTRKTAKPAKSAKSALSLPETERACTEVLSLPLHLGMTKADVSRVAKAVRAWRP